MIKIGLINCSNATQDLNCAAIGCLKALNNRAAYFADYPEGEPIELTGIISCAGCPTLSAPRKILKRVKSLIEFDIDVLHFSFCIKHGCPFKNKYEKVIKEKYPDLKIVHGSHADPDDAVDKFKANMNELLAPSVCVPQDMNDHIKKRVKLI
ncbi:MAG: CGGC domain-containing protein [Desulfobacteraceae bacterium]|nr:CGGC domain-containing protein [Desulfobacteraceae bacterium]